MGKKAREKRLRAEATAKAVSAAAPAPAATSTELPWEAQSERRASATAAATWYLPAALFALALLVRGVLLFQLSGTPYTEVENIDTKGYIRWAQEILAGEWLPRRHFYQSPLYAYYLALVYALTGVGHWVARCVQVLVGGASVVLVYGIAKRVFSQRVGVIAALMLCFYGPLIAEEIMLAKTALAVCLTLLSIYLFLRALSQGDRRGMFGAGVAFAIAVVGVGQWFPVLIGLAAYVALAARGRGSQRRQLTAALLGGAAVILLPLFAWNSYWSGGLMLSSGDAGLNLFIGNNPLTTGLPGRPATLRDLPWFEEEDSKRLAEKDAGRSLNPAQVSQHRSRRAAGWAISHPGDSSA
jgi:4-amino-4-deoxy-L-arabinose transferase-like glycosyltransferase